MDKPHGHISQQHVPCLSHSHLWIPPPSHFDILLNTLFLSFGFLLVSFPSGMPSSAKMVHHLGSNVILSFEKKMINCANEKTLPPIPTSWDKQICFVSHWCQLVSFFRGLIILSTLPLNCRLRCDLKQMSIVCTLTSLRQLKWHAAFIALTK